LPFRPFREVGKYFRAKASLTTFFFTISAYRAFFFFLIAVQAVKVVASFRARLAEKVSGNGNSARDAQNSSVTGSDVTILAALRFSSLKQTRRNVANIYIKFSTGQDMLSGTKRS
jgi:hypothetical protein